MDDVIDRLLKIKEFREDKAQLDVNRARRVLEEADTRLDASRKELEAHRADCLSRERAMYAELCTRQVRLWDLQSVSLKVDEFKQIIQAGETRVEEARAQRETCAQGLNDARQRHQEAARKREKFTELSALSQADAQAQAARVEDAEMEEVPVKFPGQAAEAAA